MNDLILIVYPQSTQTKDHRFGYSLTMLYIASGLQELGYDIKLCDFTTNKYSVEEYENYVATACSVIVEIDSFPLKRSENYRHALEIAKTTKHIKPDICIIAYGKHCSLASSPIPGYDLTITGEPEIYVPQLFKGGFVNKCNDRMTNVGLIEDLNMLPFPARHLLSHDQIRGGDIGNAPSLAPSAVMETSRGCNGSCSFCQRKGWIQGYRTLAVDRVKNELSTLIESGTRNIWFVDENFTADIKRAKSLLKEMRSVPGIKTLKIALSSWIHIDYEILYLAKEASVSIMSFGMESVDSNIQNFYKKKYDPNKAKGIIEYADKMGIYTVGNFIFGAPMETHETIQKTMTFAIETPFDEINIKMLDYMIGSDIYQEMPLEFKDQTHIFAEKNNGLTQFELDEMKEMALKYKQKFKLAHMKRLINKMERFGPPYERSHNPQ